MSLTATDLPREDYRALRDILLQWKSDGVDRPLVPLNFDADGDGICDAWGLNDQDEVVLISGVDLEDTVAVSDGTDEEVGADV